MIDLHYEHILFPNLVKLICLHTQSVVLVDPETIEVIHNDPAVL